LSLACITAADQQPVVTRFGRPFGDALFCFGPSYLGVPAIPKDATPLPENRPNS
jgi:hypothetical protein